LAGPPARAMASGRPPFPAASSTASTDGLISVGEHAARRGVVPRGQHGDEYRSDIGARGRYRQLSAGRLTQYLRQVRLLASRAHGLHRALPGRTATEQEILRLT